MLPIAFAGFTAPKILWVKKNEPEIFEKCKKIWQFLPDLTFRSAERVLYFPP